MSNFLLFLLFLALFQSYGSKIPLTRIETKLGDPVYLGVISVGQQNFNVEINLQSSVLWVPECLKGTITPKDLVACCNGACNNKNVFDRSSSRTFFDPQLNRPMRYNFSQCANVSAIIGADTFKLGPHYRSGDAAKRVPFALAEAMPDCYMDLDYDGVLGLAPVEENAIYSPIVQYFKRNNFAKPILTFFIMKPSPNNLIDGQITIEGLDEEHCEPRTFQIPPDKSGWAFEVPSFFLNNVAFNPAGRKYLAFIDLNTDYFFVPTEVFEFILKTTAAQKLPNQDRYLLAKPEKWTIRVVDGFNELTIKLAHLCDQKQLNMGCVLNIAVSLSSKFETNFVFGTPILYDHSSKTLLTRTENKAQKTVAYVGVISVGNQNFNVEFNLVSSALFVPECKERSVYPEDLISCCNGACNNRNTFIRKDSRTFHECKLQLNLLTGLEGDLKWDRPVGEDKKTNEKGTLHFKMIDTPIKSAIAASTCS
uniref:Peptidase A1 domain-containing protein n=1 Tax=Bursaphelenchus xylophilus TaxID=6326 RepID=A0A1I7RQS0_BURXY